MIIVAIAWIYVVLMMSLTETSIVAGIMTFLMYCVLPLLIILYLMGGSRRKRKRAAMAKAAMLLAQQAKKNPSGPE
jgi:cytochrome c biogenesis protein CcdA